MSQESPPAPDVPFEAPRKDEREQPLFKLVIVSSATFLVTVLSMTVSMMFPSESPASKFINRNGLQIIGVEVVLIIVSGILAMAVDRRRTIARQRQAIADAAAANEADSAEVRIDRDGHGSVF
jgi:hypothetical protein